MRRGSIGVVLVLSAGLARGAFAQAPGMRLDYERAADVAPICPDEEAFRELVGIFAKGEDPFAAQAAGGVRVAFDRQGARYRATITVLGPDGAELGAPEEHTSRECFAAALHAASAVFLIVAPPTPPAASQPLQTPLGMDLAPTWVPPSLPSENLHPLPPLPRKMDVTIGLSALVLMSAGLTSNVGPGFGITADVRGGWFSLGLELRGVLPSTTFATETVPGKEKKADSAEFDASQWTALLVPCGRWKYLFGCAVAQAGFLYAQGPSSGRSFPNVGFGPRLGVEIPFAERFAVFGMAEALFYALGAQPRFVIDLPASPAPNLQWSQPIASGFFGAGLSVKFE